MWRPSKGDSDSRPERFYGLGTEPRTDDDADAIVEADRASEELERQTVLGAGVSGFQEGGHYQSPAAISIRRAAPYVGGGLIAVLLLSILWFCLATQQVSVAVNGFEWNRTIEVEQERTFHESDWDTPGGAYNVSNRRKWHHDDHVIDHYVSRRESYSVQVPSGTRTERYKSGTQSLGNGHFKDVYSSRTITTYHSETRYKTVRDPVYRDVPVYRTWYTYDVDRWVHERTERAGDVDQNPNWPQIHLGRNEREGQRTESYKLFMDGPKGRRLEKALPQQEWQRYKMGDTLIAHVTRLGVVMKIE